MAGSTLSSSNMGSWISLLCTMHTLHHPWWPAGEQNALTTSLGLHVLLSVLSIQEFSHLTLQPPPPLNSQSLTLQDPQTVDRYLSFLNKFLANHNFTDKVASLSLTTDLGNWLPHHSSQYDALDEQITEGMKHAEKKSSTQFTGKYLWSLTLAHTGKSIHFIDNSVNEPSSTQHHSTTLSSAKDSNITNIEASLICTIEAINAKITASWQHLHACQATHQQLCQDYLTDLAQALTLKKFA